MEISGSCLCNAVQYKLTSAPRAVVNCHCNFCRKHSGAAFSTYAVFPEAALEITAGQDFIEKHDFSAQAHKHFCRQCGSPLFNRNAKYPGLYMIYLGGISASLDMTPSANIHCDSQLPWVVDLAGIRSFAQGIAKST